jgi:hypothetical protein
VKRKISLAEEVIEVAEDSDSAEDSAELNDMIWEII